MSQVGFTPIQVYRSATPGAVPLAGNLAAGELALNTADQKLFFKNAGGTVVNIDTANGTVTSVSGTGTVNGITLTGTVTSSGSLTLGGTLSGVSLTSQVSGTLPVANGGTGVTSSTGTVAVVLSNTPTLVTPILGVASATSIATGLGLVGTPAYTFTGDLNTGMWSPAADTVAVSTGGTERMRISSAGLVGIGTSAPSVTLDVAGTIRSVRNNAEVRTTTATGYGWRMGTTSSASTLGYMFFQGTTDNFATSFIDGMAIDTSGRVGIGTSAPLTKLNLEGGSFLLRGGTIDIGPTAGANGAARISSSLASSVLGTLIFSTQNSSAVMTEAVRIDSSGNVGIGTSAPSAKLNVAGDTIISGNADARQIGFNFYGTSQYNFYVDGATDSARMTIRRGTTSVATFDSSGNLGVSATPSAWGAGFKAIQMQNGTVLASHPTVPITYLISNSYYDGTNNRYVVNGFASRFLCDGNSGGFTWGTATTGTAGAVVSFTDRMTLDASGNVGIGTSAPVGRLMVAATDTSNTIGSATASINITNIDAGAFGRTSNLNFTVDDGNLTSRRLATISAVYTGFSGGSTAGALVFATQFDGSLSERMRIVEAGGVGIGTSTPAYQLQLSADSAAKPTSSLWTIASDSRVKTETGEYTKGLDAVCALRPITYHYNGAAGFTADGKENISIIAQEAIQHFPECVGTFEALLNEGDEEKTELFNWNGHALTFALVNAVKELKAVNDTLTARVAQLEGNQP